MMHGILQNGDKINSDHEIFSESLDLWTLPIIWNSQYDETLIHHFHQGTLKKNDGCGKRIDMGAYIK
jgi:hypothetical protein